MSCSDGDGDGDNDDDDDDDANDDVNDDNDINGLGVTGVENLAIKMCCENYRSLCPNSRNPKVASPCTAPPIRLIQVPEIITNSPDTAINSPNFSVSVNCAAKD